MSFLVINGLVVGRDIPNPTRDVTPTVTTVVNAGRNANGVVVGQRIGRDQYKLDSLKWAWLTAEEWSRLLSALSPFYVPVTFQNPVTNGETTITMYCGDRTATPYWIDENGKPTHYKDCKVNLIDTGA